MSVMAKIEADGECRFTAAVRVAQLSVEKFAPNFFQSKNVFFCFYFFKRLNELSLKHRMNKNHKQRIVVFVCSPVQEEEKELVKVAKRLKKEKVN